MAFLKIISPEGIERTVELIEHNTLGRHPDNTVQLLDRIVSKNHCHIDRSDGKYVLIDQGSLNGTYVNGERVQGTRVLKQDDEITLGSTRSCSSPARSNPPNRRRPLTSRRLRSRVCRGA
jgi:adenylate cyclase